MQTLDSASVLGSKTPCAPSKSQFLKTLPLMCVADFTDISGQSRTFTSQNIQSLYISILDILIQKCNLDNPFPRGVHWSHLLIRCIVITLLVLPAPLSLSYQAQQNKLKFISFYFIEKFNCMFALSFFLGVYLFTPKWPTKRFAKQRQFPPQEEFWCQFSR